MITLRTLYCVPSETTKVRSTLPGLAPGRVTGVTFTSKKPLAIVVIDELLPVFVEHVAVILAEEPQDRLPRADLGPQLSTRGEMVPDEVDAVDLDLGSLEDLDHDLGVAGIAPFEQRDRGQVVALLLIEPLDLTDRQPGPRRDPRGCRP